MKLQKPKGTQDILPQESAKWQYVEEFARETFRKYNYAEIRTPIFEHYEVISRSVGDTTDIVTKEMYDFYDKGDRHITRRSFLCGKQALRTRSSKACQALLYGLYVPL